MSTFEIEASDLELAFEREEIALEEVNKFITKYETRMQELGYDNLESWKMLRNELDFKLDKYIEELVEVRQL